MYGHQAASYTDKLPDKKVGSTIAVDPKGIPWTHTGLGLVFKQASSAWVEQPGYAVDMSIGRNGDTWKIDTSDNFPYKLES